MPKLDSLPLISIVTPLLNEQENIREFYVRITQILGGQNIEILFVDDGSTDHSWNTIQELAQNDSRVKAISFSRNFGHQPALTAGINYASGDAVVLLDCDLQDPPELIPEMISKWQQGFDVVYGVRKERKGETFFKKVTASMFYYVFRKASRLNVPLEAGDFRLLSRKVVDILKKDLPERIRFLRGLTSWVGFKQIGIEYIRAERLTGKTKFPLFKMLKFAFDGITSFSSVPLQFSGFLGLAGIVIALLFSLQALYVRLFTDTAVKGWTSLFIVMLFLGSVQLLMIGVIGEYIGRIYEEIKQRPLFLVRSTIGLEKKDGFMPEKV